MCKTFCATSAHPAAHRTQPTIHTVVTLIPRVKLPLQPRAPDLGEDPIRSSGIKRDRSKHDSHPHKATKPFAGTILYTSCITKAQTQ